MSPHVFAGPSVVTRTGCRNETVGSRGGGRRGASLALYCREVDRNNNAYTALEADMLKGLTKLIAYKKAPKKTFALLHPVKALKWGAAFFVAKKVWNRVGGSETSRG